MMYQRSIRAMVGILVVLIALPAFGQQFPKPVGYVNDFAKVLTPATASGIETTLHAYKDATGIEVAVATVSSLGDMSVEEYANKLFRQWGVGEKGKSNGVLVLMAPVEHKIRIEVGYGLEGDLTDGAAGDIIRDVAIPKFKANDYPAGLQGTVEAVIAHLGSKPFQARAEERQRQKEEEQKRYEAEKAMFQKVVASLLLLALIIAPPLGLMWRRQRRKELHVDIATVMNNCNNHLQRIVGEAASSRKKLGTLRDQVPARDYTDAVQDLDKIEKGIRDSTARLQALSNISGDSLGVLADKCDRLLDFNERLDVFSAHVIVDRVVKNIVKRTEAEADSKRLFASLPKKISAAQKSRKLDEKRIDQACKNLDKAERETRKSEFDWLTVLALLTSADHLLDEERPILHRDVARHDTITHHSDYNQSGFSSSSSSMPSVSSDTSSSFSFGGGDTGGAGATGSW